MTYALSPYKHNPGFKNYLFQDQSEWKNYKTLSNRTFFCSECVAVPNSESEFLILLKDLPNLLQSAHFLSFLDNAHHSMIQTNIVGRINSKPT